jgi:Mn-dependent DtxR family transcriptional regulator
MSKYFGRLRETGLVEFNETASKVRLTEKGTAEYLRLKSAERN